MSISQLFEELQVSNSELKVITPISITGSHFGTMTAILDFFKCPYLSCLKSYRAEIQNLNYFLPHLLLAAILETQKPSWIFQMSISQPFEELQGSNLENKLIVLFGAVTQEGAEDLPTRAQRAPALDRSQKEGCIAPQTSSSIQSNTYILIQRSHIFQENCWIWYIESIVYIVIQRSPILSGKLLEPVHIIHSI